MSKDLTIAVVGATGSVGREMVAILDERNVSKGKILLFASSNSIGEKIQFCGKELIVQELTNQSFQGVDIALFSAGEAVSKEYAPQAVAAGCIVIDNSGAWRMDDRCPLVIPEINIKSIQDNNGIIANPNCSTIQLLAVLAPLHAVSKIKRVVISTYQSVSGTGQKAISEMEQQVRHLLNVQEPEVFVYPKRIAFNCLPHIDSFLENGYTKEEMKIVNETSKILEDTHIKVTATCVRVPVFYGHAESVNIETEEKITPQVARAILAQTSGIYVYDNPHENIYPTPIDSVGEDDVFVGRIREDFSIENGLNLWIVADNLRKGAALNAVQIVEVLIRENLLSIKNPRVFL